MKEYGEYGTFARRVTYLLDGDGLVQQVWDVEDAAGHPGRSARRRRGLTDEAEETGVDAPHRVDEPGAG